MCPRHSPERTASAKALIRSRTSCTSLTTSRPSTSSDRSRGIRSATCRTGRSSVTLIRSPRNIASIRAREPRLLGERDQQAQCLVDDAVLREVEEDAHAPRGSGAPRAPASSAKSCRRWTCPTSRWWRASSCHAARSRNGVTRCILAGRAPGFHRRRVDVTASASCPTGRSAWRPRPRRSSWRTGCGSGSAPARRSRSCSRRSRDAVSTSAASRPRRRPSARRPHSGCASSRSTRSTGSTLRSTAPTRSRRTAGW